MTDPAPPGRASIQRLEDDPDDAVPIRARLKRAKLDADVRRLHQLGTRRLRENDVDSALQQVLRACVDPLGADKGNVRILDEDKAALRIVAHVGFDASVPRRWSAASA